jgi:Domain of unknown function (DUF4189)
MRRLAPAKVFLVLTAIIGCASAAHAVVKHSAPARPAAVHPHSFAFHGTRLRTPTHSRNFGRHGLPIVAGKHGRHEARNRSAFATFPGIGDDFDGFIDSIDDTGPLEPVAACPSNCKFGAMSIANDGTWGGAWNYPDADTAKAVAVKNCVGRTKERCGGLFLAAGTAWIAGLLCERYSPTTNWHWGVMGLGNDLPSAIRNVYRIVKQNGFYNASECAFVAAVAADGSQVQYLKHE